MNRRLLVDLDALAANYRLCREAAGTGAAAGAVVKADAYGTGMTAVAERLFREGCRAFFVASADEGLALRSRLGADPEIFLFEGPERDSAADLAAAGITPVLNHPGQLQCWLPYAEMPAAVHVDTGMSRLGFDRAVSADDFRGVTVSLLMSHLACADEPEHPLNAIQRQRFDELRGQFPGVRTSLENSAGWLAGSGRNSDLGRPGIGLYGGNPFLSRPNPCQPVAALQGRVLQVKTLAAGEAVGYGASHVLDGKTRVAVVALGYADGVPRALSGCGALFLGGRRCPILGRVSMDMTVVSVEGLEAVQTGDWAECFGARLPLDEVARQAATIPYTLLTGVGPRVPRLLQPLSAADDPVVGDRLPEDGKAAD